MKLERTLVIGSLKLTNALLLAPMEGYTDTAFRHICAEFGADLVYTEFVSSEGLRRTVSRSSRKIRFEPEEGPVGVQIFGNQVQAMVEAARIAARLNPVLVDLNFGCPVRKVAGKGAGAALMKNPELLWEIARAVVEAVELPVTAKLRLGWDHDSINILEIARGLEEAGIAALTLHARTRAQKYTGRADWDWIRRLKETVSVPVIGNGDVLTPGDAERMFLETGCDAVMIGRGAVNYPWIFRDTRSYLETGKIPPAPTLEERLQVLEKHFRLARKLKGERRGLLEMRKHYAGYLKGYPHVRRLRNELVTLNDPEAVLHRLALVRREGLEHYADKDPS